MRHPREWVKYIVDIKITCMYAVFTVCHALL